jgi:hypothetical protein
MKKNISLSKTAFRLQLPCVCNCACATRVVCVCVCVCVRARACVHYVRTCVRAVVLYFVLNMHLLEQLMQESQILSRTFLMSQTANPKVHERVCARTHTPAWHA